MTKTYCDRCGKCIYHSMPYGLPITDVVGLEVEIPLVKYSKTVDLCAQCHLELKNLLEEVVDNFIANKGEET